MPTHTAENIANSEVTLAAKACQEARSLLSYGTQIADSPSHRRTAARLLLAAAARVLPAGERNDTEGPITAIHDYLLVTLPVGPDERAENNVRLRRIFRDLCRLATVVAHDLEQADANGSPHDDWSDVKGWLCAFAEPEGPTVYEDDLDRYRQEELVA